MKLNVVVKEQWNFTLYSTENNERYLSVLCGGVAMYDLNIKLTSEEIAYISENRENLNSLVVKIQNSPSQYTSRNIQLPS